MTEKPQILYLTNSDWIGGMERCVVNATREFKLRGWRVRTFFLDTPKSQALLKWCSNQGVEAEVSSNLLSYYQPHTLLAMIRLRNFVAKFHSQIVHLHYGSNHISLKDILSIRLSGSQPCIVSVHGSKAWESSNENQRRSTYFAAKFCHAFIVHSEATRKVLLETGIHEKKVHLVPLGLYPPLNPPSKASARQHLDIAENAFVITINARQVEHKGITDLIEAVSQLPDPEKELFLLIAGTGPDQPKFEELASRKLPGRFRFVGQVDDHSNLYAATDVFTLPSHDAQESFGLVVIEAAFHAVPSVGTTVGGIPEAILDQETGLLVPPYSPSKLAEALQRLRLDLNLRTRLGETAQKRALTRFTASVMAEKYRQIYESLLKREFKPGKVQIAEANFGE